MVGVLGSDLDEILYQVCCGAEEQNRGRRAEDMILWIAGVTCVLLALYTLYVEHIHRKYAHLPGPPLDNLGSCSTQSTTVLIITCISTSTAFFPTFSYLVVHAATNYFLGNLPTLRQQIKVCRKNRHIVFLSWAEKYGPLYRIFLLHRCILIPSSQALVKEFLTNSRYPKARLVYDGLFSLCGERFLGRGLVTTKDYHHWKKKRTSLNPIFHSRYLRTLMDQFNQAADVWIEKLEMMADGRTPLSMLHSMHCAALDAIGKIAFNIDFDVFQDKKSAFPRFLDTVLDGYSTQLHDPLLKFKWSQREYCAAVKDALKFIRQEARRALAQRQRDMSAGFHVPRDVLTLLLEYLDSHSEISAEDAIDEFVTTIIAGQETTGNTLSFLLMEVGRNPQIYQKLQEEVDTVLGDKPSVTSDDLDRLQYLSDLFKETLRLYPPAPGTARENPAEVTVDGFRIPKDSFLLISFFVMHRLSKNFPEPEVFNPDRWRTENRFLFSYMPFSLGQRGCMGKYFAQIESKVLLSKFLQRFDFHLDPSQSFDIKETATLRPEGGVVTTLYTR